MRRSSRTGRVSSLRVAERITYDTVRTLACKLADVHEGSSYGAPALKVKHKLFIRLRDDLDSIVVKMPFAEREELIAANPAAYYITDHYVKYEWMLVRLAAVGSDALSDLVQIAYKAACARPSRTAKSTRGAERSATLRPQ